MRHCFILLAIPLLLAACAQDESAPVDNTVEEITPGMAATGAEQSLADPAPGSVTAPNSAASALPAAMQGRWGMTIADCDPARSDNKGLMVVSGNTLRFYESRGTVRQAVAEQANRVRATIAFTGEGMTWETEDTFTLDADGGTLTRRSVDRNGMYGPFDYRRCA